MAKSYKGLPAAANMEQSIILAQLQILRSLERERTSIVRTCVTELETDSEVVASWSPAEE